MNRKEINLGYIRQRYLDELQRYVNKPIIKVIVGMRRSGKSILLYQFINYLIDRRNIPKTDILYIDKESYEFDSIKDYQDLHAYVSEFSPKYLLIDEVQEIEGWEKAIASFHNQGIDVYITGSNAKMLSSDLATHLAGRYVSIPIYSFSFKEFIEAHNYTDPDHSKAFDAYLKLGGFPILTHFTGDQHGSYAIINDILETIVVKDIITKHKIRRINLLHNIINFLADNIGNTFSATGITKYLKSQRIKLDVDTALGYMDFLTSTFAFHLVRRYDIRGKKHLEVSNKYYLGDLSLRHALIGYRQTDINAFLENIVFIELLRRGYRVSVGKLDDLEIDFIAEKFDHKMYIQVTFLLSNEKVFQREFTPLRNTKDDYPKYVLSMDPEIYGTSFNGIHRKNIIDWLLEEA